MAARPKIHILRNPWEEVRQGESWTRCGTYALVAPKDELEVATCFTCRSSVGLPKTILTAELPNRVIPCLPDSDLQALYDGLGWKSIRLYGRLEVCRSSELCTVRDVSIPLWPFSTLSDYRGPQDLWGTNPDLIPRGYHVLVLKHLESRHYGVLRSLKSLGAVKVACESEKGLEGPPGVRKTWLERLLD